MFSSFHLLYLFLFICFLLQFFLICSDSIELIGIKTVSFFLPQRQSKLGLSSKERIVVYLMIRSFSRQVKELEGILSLAYLFGLVDQLLIDLLVGLMYSHCFSFCVCCCIISSCVSSCIFICIFGVSCGCGVGVTFGIM